MIIKTLINSIKEFDDLWFEETLRTLPSWRKERALKHKTSDGRKLSILAGKLVMDAFIENDKDPEDVIFNDAGKPMVGGDRPFYFSISHSKNAVAVSVSTPYDNSSTLPGDNRIDTTRVFETASVPPRSFLKSSQGLTAPSVGVDIECIRPYDEGLVKRFFTKEEQNFIHFAQDKDENFTQIWTSKEAYGKFTGGGVQDGLKFSMFHDPTVPLNVILPCCFEHSKIELDGDRYLYALCYGVVDEEVK